MPLDVSKDCFPAPTKCHNCARRTTNVLKKESDPKKEFKRCGKCHMMTYCDKDCQREHWMAVHKKHCRFLSGKVLVNGSKHNAATCSQCAVERQSSPTQLRSDSSPKSACNIEQVAVEMKKTISSAFGFHEEGKKCNCSLEYAFELPFPLGEVSGQYLEVAGTGLDVILAHCLKILAAMNVKTKKQEYKDALVQLWFDIIDARSQLWVDILVCAMPMFHFFHLSEKVDRLKTIYGASNPWWKTLVFSVDFITKTNWNLISNLHDSQSLEDPRFKTFKLLLDYRHSQLQNQAIACEKKTWPNFLLWPELVNGSLALLLPPGICCQSCFAQLDGEVAITPQELNYKTMPGLLSEVSDNGALMACCPFAQNPICMVNCMSKDVERRIRSDVEQMEGLLKETKLFLIDARECDFCFKESLFSHRCSACLTVQYCSTVCQKKDLDFHKTVCSTWDKDQSRKILDRKSQRAHWKSAIADLGDPILNQL